MPNPLYESRAKGGPLDGIKLSSGLGWDGKIVKRRSQGFVHYHAGYYAWNHGQSQWVWHPCLPSKLANKPYMAGRGQGLPQPKLSGKKRVS